MMPKIFIPEFVFWLNIIIVLINTTNVCVLFYKFYHEPIESKVFIVLLLFNAVSLLSVNIPSSINHYIMYFSSKNDIPIEATWLRFWDRYSMLFKSGVNALMTSKYCIQWMKKFYK